MSKTAFITGASSGIGAATARALAELGYDLVITGRRTDRLQALNDRLEKEFGVKALVLGFDVRDRFQTESAIDALPGHFRTIDVLVNNAGLASGFEHIDEGDPMDWDKMIDTNVKGLALRHARRLADDDRERARGPYRQHRLNRRHAAL